jgi:2-haloacid dehalogenase
VRADRSFFEWDGSMADKTTIVFDFGGVLIDWNPYYLYRKVLKNDEEIKAFLDEIDFKHWNPKFDRGYSFEKGVEEKCVEFPHREDLIRRFNSHWLDAMGDLLTGTVEIVRGLKAAGYQVYGLSNWSVEKYNLVKDRFEFLSWLDGYLLSGQVQQVKPEPEIFHTFLSRFNLEAANCLFVDDVAENIQTAQRIGFQTIQFQTSAQLADELISRGIVIS